MYITESNGKMQVIKQTNENITTCKNESTRDNTIS